MSNEALTTTQPKPPSAQLQLKEYLETNKGSIAQVLTHGLKADRVLKVVLSATLRNADLLKCSKLSILQAVMYAAQLGLEPGSPLGHAYLVPFKDTCQLIVGYKGLIDLALRGGKVRSVEARVVHRCDVFRVAYGLNPRLDHEPVFESDEDDANDMIAVYAIARLENGDSAFDVMSKAQVDAIRRRSRTSGSGPWVTDYEEMARKTVVKRLSKYLPLSIEAQEAIAKAEAIEVGDAEPEPQTSPLPPQSQLAAKIEANTPDLDEAGFGEPPPVAAEPPPPAHQAEFMEQPQLASDEQVATLCKRIFSCANEDEVAKIRAELESGRKDGTLNFTKAQGAQIRQSLEGKSKSLVASAKAAQ